MEEAAVSSNLYSSHEFAEEIAQVSDEGNPSETSAEVDDDFEFSDISSNFDRPVFPVFDRDLLTCNDPDERDSDLLFPFLPVPLLRMNMGRRITCQNDPTPLDYRAVSGRIVMTHDPTALVPPKQRDRGEMGTGDLEADESDGKKLTKELFMRRPLEKRKPFAYESDDEEHGPPSSPLSESEADQLQSVLDFTHISTDFDRSDFPVSNRNLLTRNQNDGKKLTEPTPRLPLEKSCFAYERDDEERDPPSSPSLESEAGELRGGVATNEDYVRRKLSDFLHCRSKSEGVKDSYGEIKAEIQGGVGAEKAGKGRAEKAAMGPAHEVFYVGKQGKKRKPFPPPYRQNLVGLFGNVGTYGNALSSFLKGRRPPYLRSASQISPAYAAMVQTACRLQNHALDMSLPT